MMFTAYKKNNPLIIKLFFAASMSVAGPVFGQTACSEVQPTADFTAPAGPQAQLYCQISNYKAAIAALDSSYSDASRELYLSLAKAYTDLGLLDEAAEAYGETLQSLRVSYGLYSQDQLATLDAYNLVLFEQEKWEQIDSNLHLANHISQKLYAQQDPRYIEAATKLASWKVKAFQTGIYKADSDRSIQEATKIYSTLIRTLPESDPQFNEKRADYLSAKGLAHFYSAQYLADLPLDEFRANVPETVAQQQCYSAVMSFDGPQPARSACQGGEVSNPEYFAAQQRVKNAAVKRHLSFMRESFGEAISVLETDANASPLELADAILRLGDASLLAEDFPRANTQYKKAWELLSQDGEALAIREQLLGKPVQVMSGVLNDLIFDKPVASEVLGGTIEFDVTERGEIENIGMKGSAEDLAKDNLGAIAIKLDQTKFRPRISEGKPVVSRISINAADL